MTEKELFDATWTATHRIKVRRKGEKVWRFLTSSGDLNRLRVHAGQWTSQMAQQWVAINAPLDPDCEFKVVPIVW